MNRQKLLFSIFVLALLAFAGACSTGNSIKGEVVTPENSGQLAEQAKQSLSYEEYELVKGYVARVHPDVPEGQLPVGMTVGTMIDSQKAWLASQGTPVEAASPSAEAAAGGSESAPPEQNTAPGAPAQAGTRPAAPPAQASAPAPAEPPAPKTATLASGAEIVIRLSQSLSSKTAQPGQSFEGVLESDLSSDGHVLAPAGSTVTGKIAHVAKSGKVKGKAQMSLALSELQVGGENYGIGTNTLNFEAQGTGGRDAKRIGIASGIGAAVGAIAGGGKGAAIGAAIGAGAGTGVTLATAGEEVEFPNEQRLSFRLEKSLELPIVQ